MFMKRNLMKITIMGSESGHISSVFAYTRLLISHWTEVALGSNLTGGPLVAPVRDDAGHSGRSRAVGTSYTMCTEGPRPLGARGGHGQPW